MSQADPGPPGRAWGWVEALRSGSTTPWSRWPADAAAGAPTARDLPGAQQLELLRRVNEAAAPAALPDGLAARILAVGAAGRGTPDLELAGATASRPWGPRPIDPEALSEAELVRFVATLLAEDVVTTGRRRAALSRRRRALPRRAAAALPVRVRRHRHRRETGHRVLGDPWLVEPIRHELLRRGAPLGRPESSVVVIGTDLATMLIDAYVARAFDDGVAPWHRWLRTGYGDRALPPRIDLAHVARRWRDEVGPHHLVVVADLARTAEALPLRPGAVPERDRPSADAVEVARRVAAPLGLLVPPAERRDLLRGVLLPRVLADNAAHPAPALAVPADRFPRVVRQAEQMRDDLRAAGYPVLGDLQALVPDDGGPGTADGPDAAGVLRLAIRLLLAGPGGTREKEEEHR